MKVRSPFIAYLSRNILPFLVLSTIGFCVSWSGYASPPAPPQQLSPGLATIQTPEGFIIFAEMAVTPAQRTKGLMFRTRLAPDRGMLFQFSEPDHWTFWMKNTKMALDILWLDEHDTIVHIRHAAPICKRQDNLCPRYRTPIPAVSVLELAAGRAEELNLSSGTKLHIDLP